MGGGLKDSFKVHEHVFFFKVWVKHFDLRDFSTSFVNLVLCFRGRKRMSLMPVVEEKPKPVNRRKSMAVISKAGFHMIIVQVELYSSVHF